MKNALLFYGGWEGHTPKETTEIFAEILKEEGFHVVVEDTMQIFDSYENIKKFDLFVPNITMSEIKKEHCTNIAKAVAEGAGMAGCHGGMCDSFRNNTTWQFLTGSQWVAHPGNDTVTYEVELSKESELTRGIENFKITSEQYYLHVDPAIKVHAATTFPIAEGEHTTNGTVTMPVVYTKYWGKGKIYYNSLGHTFEIFKNPDVRELMRRGFLWAVR